MDHKFCYYYYYHNYLISRTSSESCRVNYFVRVSFVEITTSQAQTCCLVLSLGSDGMVSVVVFSTSLFIRSLVVVATRTGMYTLSVQVLNLILLLNITLDTIVLLAENELAMMASDRSLPKVPKALLS